MKLHVRTWSFTWERQTLRQTLRSHVILHVRTWSFTWERRVWRSYVNHVYVRTWNSTCARRHSWRANVETWSVKKKTRGMTVFYGPPYFSAVTSYPCLDISPKNRIDHYDLRYNTATATASEFIPFPRIPRTVEDPSPSKDRNSMGSQRLWFIPYLAITM